MSAVPGVSGPSPRVWRFLKFILPIMLATFYGTLLYLMLDWETFRVVGGGMLVYFLPPLGKESVIPAMVALGIDPMFAAMSIAIVDIFGAIWLAWNFDLFERIPGFGWVIRKIEGAALRTLESHPWMDELAFLGLVAFVIVPFQGSGAVGASIFGNIIAMKPERVLLAVEIGAIVGTLAIAYSTSFMLTLLYTNATLASAVLVFAIALGFASMTAPGKRAMCFLGRCVRPRPNERARTDAARRRAARAEAMRAREVAAGAVRGHGRERKET